MRGRAALKRSSLRRRQAIRQPAESPLIRPLLRGHLLPQGEKECAARPPNPHISSNKPSPFQHPARRDRHSSRVTSPPLHTGRLRLREDPMDPHDPNPADQGYWPNDWPGYDPDRASIDEECACTAPSSTWRGSPRQNRRSNPRQPPTPSWTPSKPRSPRFRPWPGRWPASQTIQTVQTVQTVFLPPLRWGWRKARTRADDRLGVRGSPWPSA